MIVEGPEPFTLTTVFIAPRSTPGDPLAQRSYLAIKMSGGIGVQAEPDHEAALTELRDEIMKRCEAALREALARPDETVVSVPTT